MAWNFTLDGSTSSVNLAPSTGAVAVWNIIQTLKQAGWTQVEDADGTTYSSSGAQVTGGASGAHGLGNNGAWVRLRDPGGTHEISIQRGTTDLVWRVKWSHSARFTGGSPGATRVSSATDEQIVNGVGGGTDASPTFTTIFGTNNTYKLHVGADMVAPYDWWWVAMDNTTGANNRKGWFLNMASGSYPSADVAPYIVDFGGSGAGAAFSSTAIKGSGYYKKGLSGEAWVAFYPGVYMTNRPGSATQLAPSTNGSASLAIEDGNPYDGYYGELPVPIFRDIAQTTPGWKGFCSTDTYCYSGNKTTAGSTVVTSGDGTKAWVMLLANGHLLRWPVGVAHSL